LHIYRQGYSNVGMYGLNLAGKTIDVQVVSLSLAKYEVRV